MTTTRRALRNIESANADPELVSSLLTSRSQSEATVALSLLRFSLSDRELVAMANLREILQQLPTGPFRTGEELDLLERLAGYEFTGRSFRRAFEHDGGRVFGIEFLGVGHDCRGIVVHTPKRRVPVVAGRWTTVDDTVLHTFLRHSMLLDAILEALELLGSPLTPTIYLAADDFLAEHSRETLRDTLGGLF